MKKKNIQPVESEQKSERVCSIKGYSMYIYFKRTYNFSRYTSDDDDDMTRLGMISFRSREKKKKEYKKTLTMPFVKFPRIFFPLDFSLSVHILWS